MSIVKLNMDMFNAADTAPAPSAPRASLSELLADAIYKKYGVNVSIIEDGAIHRFRDDRDSAGEVSGWYSTRLLGQYPVGWVGDWHSKRCQTISAWSEHELTPAQLEEQRQAAAEAIKASEEMRAQAQADAAAKIKEQWETYKPAPEDFPYLKNKKVKPHGTRVTINAATGREELIIPLYVDGQIVSCQRIYSENGKFVKRFLKDGRIKNAYFAIPKAEGAGQELPVFICEGFATGASIHEATGAYTFCAMSADNLTAIAKDIRAEMGEKLDLVIVADNDDSGTGIKAANKAAGETKARVIMPPRLSENAKGTDANDYAVSGRDLRSLLLNEERLLIPTRIMCEKPEPIRWLIKNIVQRGGLHIFYGEPGSGKSFLANDMSLACSSAEIKDWLGFPVRHWGAVVYLTGEGRPGLIVRNEVWFRVHGNVNRRENQHYTGYNRFDLNTPEGVNYLIREIEYFTKDPVLVVLDTLNNFYAGDENSAQEMRTMINACEEIKKHFLASQCAVILLHHMPVQKEQVRGAAQSIPRPRGSSSIMGAVDIAMCVQRQDMYSQVLTLTQTKNKNAPLVAPFEAELCSWSIPEWLNDDGEAESSLYVAPLQAARKLVYMEPCSGLAKNVYDAYIACAKEQGTPDMIDQYDGMFYLPQKMWCDYFSEHGLNKNGVPYKRPDDAKRGFKTGHTALIERRDIETKDTGHSWRIVGFESALDRTEILEAVQRRARA